jgi:hypothetical protein
MIRRPPDFARINMAALPALPAYVYDGRECVGLVLARGRKGHEAFTVDEHSLGLFETAAKAANAVFDAAANEEAGVATRSAP